MSVIAALFSGISGIVSNGSALSVAGDNIANMSTPAFKSSVPVFESALSQRIGEAEIGLGGRLAGTTANFTQGSFANTTRATDLAVQGSGFFVVESTGGDTYYTRAGSFEKNSDGDLVTSAGGFVLQGYAIDDTGSVSSSLSSINFQSVSSAPVETDSVSISANLDSSLDIRVDAFDGSSFTLAESTSDFNVTTDLYDSLGNARTVRTYFRHTAANTWQYHVLTDGTNLTNGPAAGTVVLTEGSITFNNDGSFNTAASSNISTLDLNGTLVAGERINTALAGANGDIQWANGAAAVDAITMDFGQATGSDAVMTQYSASSAVTKVEQTGRAAGSLQTIEVDPDGIIVGTFSNGTTRDLYQIPLAIFANEEGLARAGSNLYAASSDSGSAQLDNPTQAGRGEIQSYKIEQSNVDLASEFVKIITYQRAFQASARTVSTAAELLQDLVQLGR